MRNEQEVLNDFEELGYRIENRTKFNRNENAFSLLKDFKYPEDDEPLIKEIEINKSIKSYKCFETFYYTPLEITMQEHKLLTELFTIWGGYNE